MRWPSTPSRWTAIITLASAITSATFAFDGSVYGIGRSQYSGDSAPQVSYRTNDAGLPDYRSGSVSFTFAFSGRSGEAFYTGTTIEMRLIGSDGITKKSVLLNDEGLGQQVPGQNVYSRYSGTLSLTSNFQLGDQLLVTANIRGTQHGDTFTSASSTSTTIDKEGNTLGTATFSFTGGPSFPWDNQPHQIQVSVAPAIAGLQCNSHNGPADAWDAGSFTQSGSEIGAYSVSVSVTNPDFQGSDTYNWAIAKAPMNTPTTNSLAASTGVQWHPDVTSSNSGGGGYYYVVPGLGTPWLPTSTNVTPPASGDYQFFVAQLADGRHTGNATDATLGEMQVNYSPYTLHVVDGPVIPAPQSITIAPGTATATVGDSVTFTASGGQGSGNYVWSGVTNVTTASNTLAVSFTTAGAGQSVSVYRKGDADFSDSNTASAIINVSAAASPVAPTATIDASLPSISVGQTTVIFATFHENTTGTVSGTQIDGNGQSPAAAGNGTSASFNFTPAAAGSYTFQARIRYNGSWGTYASCSVTVDAAPPVTSTLTDQAISLSPTNATTTKGGQLTFTVSGGQGTGSYVWFGAASATTASNSLTVTFNTAGTAQSVFVRHNGDSEFNPSNVVSASVDVGSSGQSGVTVTISGTSGQHSLRENKPN